MTECNCFCGQSHTWCGEAEVADDPRYEFTVTIDGTREQVAILSNDLGDLIADYLAQHAPNDWSVDGRFTSEPR